MCSQFLYTMVGLSNYSKIWNSKFYAECDRGIHWKDEMDEECWAASRMQAAHSYLVTVTDTSYKTVLLSLF
jgi:hypothetical protein